MRIIISARAVWAATKDSEVSEKARTASMMAKKSRVEMVICCGGDADAVCNISPLQELWYRGPEAREVERKSGLWKME